MQYKLKVAMIVTKEQFENHFKQPLEQMGKNDGTWGYWDNDNYLTSRTDGHVGNYCRSILGDENIFYIDDYNQELFLALSAMTDKEDGNVGEWWKFIGDGVYEGLSFTHNKLYKQILPSINNSGAFTDNQGGPNGFHVNNFNESNSKTFVKATKEEIIATFGNNIMKNRILTPENATRIINIACLIWKRKLAEEWAMNIVLNKNIDISEEFYQKMRNACTIDQHKLFDDIFGNDDDGLVCINDLEIGEAIKVTKGSYNVLDRIILRTYSGFVDINKPSSTWGFNNLINIYGKKVKLTITYEEVK